MRRTIIGATAAAAVLLAACGSTSSGSGSGATAASGTPLKIAAIPVQTGSLAVYGQSALQADQFAADQANAHGGIDGHKVELVPEQTTGTPASTLSAARRAVEQSGAHFITSIMTDPEQLAVYPQLSALNAIDINTLSTADADNGSSCIPQAFRVVPSNSMALAPLSTLLKTLPAHSWDILAEDYDVGHNNAQVFTTDATKAGDTVNKQLFSPLGTTDFGSYISQLKGTTSDGLLLVEYGTDASSFISQAAQFGLLSKYKSIVGIDTLNAPLLPAVGNNALGMYETVDWAASLNNPLNRAFISSWQKKYGSAPYYVDADNYLGMQAIFHAVEKAKSVNPAAVQKALRNLSFNSIVGQVTFNPQDNQLERPQYIVQVVKGNIAAGLGWKIVDTVPASASVAANAACHMSGS